MRVGTAFSRPYTHPSLPHITLLCHMKVDAAIRARWVGAGAGTSLGVGPIFRRLLAPRSYFLSWYLSASLLRLNTNLSASAARVRHLGKSRKRYI